MAPPVLFIVRPTDVLAVRLHSSAAASRCDRITRAAVDALIAPGGLTAAQFAYIVAQLATLESEVRAIRDVLSHSPNVPQS